MFFGDASRAESWFSDTLGFPRQPNTSAVDFILDLISVDFSTKVRRKRRKRKRRRRVGGGSSS